MNIGQDMGLNEIPSAWEVKKINKVALLNPDNLTSQTDDELLIQYVDIESVSEGKINNYKPFLFKDAPSRARRKVAEKDIIISTVRPYLKAFAMIKDIHPNTICSTGFAVLRAIEGLSVAEYLYQFISSDIFLNQLLRKMVGSNYPAVNTTEFAKTVIAIPTSLYEQKKISKILTTIDNNLYNTEKLIDKYKKIRQGLMQDLFTRGVKSDGKLRPSYVEDKCYYYNDKLGVFPKEWKLMPLSKITIKIADRDHTTPQYVEHGVPIVSPKDFDDLERISFGKCAYISIDDHLINKKKTDISKGDIIFTRIGAGLGKACIVTGDMPEFSILHSAAMIRPDNNCVLGKYLLYALKSEFIQKQIKEGIQSIGVPDLGMDKMKNLMFPIPILKEQEIIADTLNAIQQKIEKEYENLYKLNQIKQGLILDLLTGKVRVKIEGDGDE